MTLFFYILIGIITFVAFLHACYKKDYDISRTIIIKKPKSEVFAFVRQLKNQYLWVPRFQKDPNIILKFRGEDGYVDAALYWKGNNTVGEGIQKIIKIKEGKLMESKLVFIKPSKNLALSYIAVKEIQPGTTKLVWGIRGRHKFPNTVVNMFHNTNRMFGKNLENGLQNLKKVLESR